MPYIIDFISRDLKLWLIACGGCWDKPEIRGEGYFKDKKREKDDMKCDKTQFKTFRGA
jgi:hypothetical protein